MILNYLPLIHGLIKAFLFLESAGSNEVNPDSALRCMEDIASSLLTLEETDQLALRLHLEKIADEERDPAYKAFVRAMSDNIGLSTPKLLP